MSDIDLAKLVEDGLSDVLNACMPEERQRVFNSLFTKFLDDTRKKDLPDLELHMQRLRSDIEALSNAVTFRVKLDESSVIIMAENSAGDTLLKLVHGTDWFEGREIGNDILEAIAGTSS